MPRNISRIQASPTFRNTTGNIGSTGRNYVSEQSGTKRHEFIGKIPQLEQITLGDYAELTLLRFRRSFGAGADDVDTPTASNNYQTPDLMNGSKAVDYSCDVKIASTNKNSTYLDVYSIVTSFGDMEYANVIYPNEYPVEMLSDAANNSGTTRFKSPHPTWTENTFKNFKGIQRTIHQLGTLYLSSEDGGSTGAQFKIQGLPPKVRRANSGMMYALMFHYSFDKNSDMTATFDPTAEIKFKEIPTENRIPFRW